MTSTLKQGIITKGVGGLYTVQVADGLYMCKARGLFRLKGQTPTVGDSVSVSVVDEVKREGYLSEIYERRNELIRPKVANVDINVIVVSAAKPAVSFELLDALLINAEMNGLQAVIAVNKTDTAEDGAVKFIVENYEHTEYKVLPMSALTGEGIGLLRAELAGRVSVLSGPSGTGKTSLLAALIPGGDFKTGELSKKTQRGAHTTRHAELLRVDEGTFVCDTPGFTSFNANNIVKEDLREYYPEFREYNYECYYNDCLHISEHDCAVKRQVGIKINEHRYGRYVRYMS
jgi:ribosome biogenesis GTPase